MVTPCSHGSFVSDGGSSPCYCKFAWLLSQLTSVPLSRAFLTFSWILAVVDNAMGWQVLPAASNMWQLWICDCPLQIGSQFVQRCWHMPPFWVVRGAALYLPSIQVVRGTWPNAHTPVMWWVRNQACAWEWIDIGVWVEFTLTPSSRTPMILAWEWFLNMWIMWHKTHGVCLLDCTCSSSVDRLELHKGLAASWCIGTSWCVAYLNEEVTWVDILHLLACCYSAAT
jgi:hypothetical protein